jgi:uncharacterized protein YjbJ (UPF0337 family)
LFKLRDEASGRRTAAIGSQNRPGFMGEVAGVLSAEETRWNNSSPQSLSGTHLQREIEMDWNRVEGNWKQVKGKVKEKWGNLTDDDLTAINGQRDQLEGKIQERYGLAKDKVRKDVDDWYNAQTW